jgi:hypothetical protein
MTAGGDFDHEPEVAPVSAGCRPMITQKSPCFAWGRWVIVAKESGGKVRDRLRASLKTLLSGKP